MKRLKIELELKAGLCSEEIKIDFGSCTFVPVKEVAVADPGNFQSDHHKAHFHVVQFVSFHICKHSSVDARY